MHKEILSKTQIELLSFVGSFKKSYYLVGGTAIALHIGHRSSIDFDLFTLSSVRKQRIYEKANESGFVYKTIFGDIDQLHLEINQVKFTFFKYPYQIPHFTVFDTVISMPSLIDLAAMKAFALARRSKWKDYVDLYFLLKYHFTIKEISQQALKYFEGQFSEKLFREQLSYHNNINYQEEVEYLVPPIDPQEIKDFLIDKATERF